MPVTARLSKKFYDRFDDEIAGEFVDWFNAVDTTYQQQLRDRDDQNWERFKAELHSAIAQLEARLTKWMFIYWSSSVLTLVGVMIALFRK